MSYASFIAECSMECRCCCDRHRCSCDDEPEEPLDLDEEVSV